MGQRRYDHLLIGDNYAKLFTKCPRKKGALVLGEIKNSMIILCKRILF